MKDFEPPLYSVIGFSIESKEKNGKYGFVNNQGVWVIKPEFKKPIIEFGGNVKYIPLYTEEGRQCIADESGNMVYVHRVQLIPNSLKSDENYIMVIYDTISENNSIYSLSNLSLKGHIEDWFTDDAELLSFKFNGKVGVLNGGRIVIEAIYDSVHYEEIGSGESDVLILVSGDKKQVFSIEENRIIR